MDYRIVRNGAFPYLFNLTVDNNTVLTAVAFEEVQEFLGVEPENYSKIDDNRFLMII